MKRWATIIAVIPLVILAIGSWRNDNFWSTPDQRGDALLRTGDFAVAAKAYADPQRIGVAQYRNGDFAAAAKTFARVPGAVGAFDQANALLMHGKYDDAIAAYDRALGFRPDWQDAVENKSVAVARKAKLDAAGQDREQESADAYKPDEVVVDQKGSDAGKKTTDLADQEMSDEQLRSTWLRQVRTTPGDFLQAKFAYQASHSEAKPVEAESAEAKKDAAP